MTKQTTNQPTIISVPLEHLLAHPENPNRMSAVNFEKLKRHIKRSGHYEPLTVRRHPRIEGSFEIINGHHRAAALRELGETCANCVVWDADDDEVRILLSTLNRLGGKDELCRKIEIVKKLSEKYNTKELAKLLPDTRQVLEKLRNITEPLKDLAADAKAYLHTLVFFLDDQQMEIAQKALQQAMPADGTKAQKAAAALTKIAQEYFVSRIW